MTGNDFRAVRMRHGLNQEDFGKHIGISRITVYQQEKRADQKIAQEKLYVRAIRDFEREMGSKGASDERA